MKERKAIKLSKSSIGAAEKEAVMAVLDREYLGMGADVQHFETLLSDFFGRPAVCVVNGTAALQLAIQACGIGTGDEVLVPSLTYVASFQAIAATGAKPVACEINPKTLQLDLSDAEKRISPNTKAIMPVHYSGDAADQTELYEMAGKYHLRIIEDAAHAFGSVNKKNQRIGSYGDISCFSFDGIKNITSGEGGCIVTDDRKVLQSLRDARLLGVEKDTEKRYSQQRSWEFDVSNQGWRYHMSNIMAAIGIVQLKRFPSFAGKRQQIAKLYDQLLKDKADQIITFERNYDNIAPHIYVVRIKNLKSRNLLQAKLAEKSIHTGFHYQPNHLLSFFKSEYSLPVTEEIASELLTLPLHYDLTEEEVQYVVDNLIKELQGSE